MKTRILTFVSFVLIKAACLADGTNFDGFQIDPAGGALLSSDSNSISFTDPGLSQPYGVVLSATGMGNANIQIDPLQMSAPGATLTVKAFGNSGASTNLPIGYATYSGGGSNQVFGSFADISASAVMVEVLDDGVLVGSWIVPGALATVNAYATSNGIPAIIGSGVRVGEDPDQPEMFFTFNDLMNFQSPTSDLYAGDEIRLVAFTGSAPTPVLARAELWAFAVPAFRILCITPGDVLLSVAWLNANTVRLSWSGGGTLQYSPSLTTGWTAFTGVQSPFTNIVNSSPLFYRVIMPGRRCCCGYTLTLINRCCDTNFAKVRVSAATPSTHILTAYVANGWSQSVQGDTAVVWTPPTGVVPEGNPIPNTFWVRLGYSPNSDQQLRVEFLDDADNVMCSQVLRTPCPKVDLDALDTPLPTNAPTYCDCMLASVDTDPDSLDFEDADIDADFDVVQVGPATYQFVNTSETSPLGLHVNYVWSITSEDELFNEHDITLPMTVDPNGDMTVTFPGSGRYDIYLEADGTSCGVESDKWADTVTVEGPEASFDVTPERCDPYTYDFQSTSSAASGHSITGWSWTVTRTSDSSIVTTGSGSVLACTFPFLNEEYEVCLEVTQDDGLTDTFCTNITPMAECEAKFDYSYYLCDDTNPPSSVTVNFVNKSSGTICPVNVNWTFGDGGTFTGLTDPSHTYAYSGTPETFDVVLMQDDGSTSCGVTNTITIAPNSANAVVMVCPNGEVHCSTTSPNPIWTAPGAYIAPGGKTKSSTRMEYYATGDYDITLTSISSNRAICSATTHVVITNITCCEPSGKKLKDTQKYVETVGGKTYRVKTKFKALNRKHASFIKAITHVNKRTLSIETKIEGTVYYGNSNCDCLIPYSLNPPTDVSHLKKTRAKAKIDFPQRFWLKYQSITVTHKVVTRENATLLHIDKYSDCQ